MVVRAQSRAKLRNASESAGVYGQVALFSHLLQDSAKPESQNTDGFDAGALQIFTLQMSGSNRGFAERKQTLGYQGLVRYQPVELNHLSMFSDRGNDVERQRQRAATVVERDQRPGAASDGFEE